MDDKDRAWYEFQDLLDDVVEQLREEPGNEHLQGKKDGLRLAATFFAVFMNPKRVSSLEALRESSPSARSTRLEILTSMVETAYIYIDEALEVVSGRLDMHPLSRVNWKQWLQWYRNVQEKGYVKEQ